MKYGLLLTTATTVLLSVTSCSQAFLSTEKQELHMMTVPVSHDSIAVLSERARQGDGQAYLQLARCYHDGYGVEHDFLMMWCMMQMATQYGAVSSSDAFLEAYPTSDPDRMLFEAMDDVGWKRYGEARQKADALAQCNKAYAALISGAIALETDSVSEALAFFRVAADGGCLLGEIALAVAERGREAVCDYADRMPMLYCQMARECFTTSVSHEEDERAAYYYRLADKYLCLDEVGIRWMHGYCEHKAKTGNPDADTTELTRLSILHSKLVKP